MSQSQEVKDKMSTSCAILQWELANMWGHVSVRTVDGKGFSLMPIRCPVDPNIPADDLLEYDLDGKMVAGRRDAIDEIFFYSCPYRAKDDVGSVIHCHPEMAMALAAVGREIKPVHTSSVRFNAGVAVTPFLYGYWLEHGEQAVKAMADGCAVLIRGHGAIVTGKTLEEACINMVQLERTAKLLLLNGALGEPQPLSPAEIEQFKSIAGSRARGKADPAIASFMEWSYYESLIKRGERWSRL
jgi:ribulose-5-phosphate 4-epimerase/fuculose-1-phosphate aldolase